MSRLMLISTLNATHLQTDIISVFAKTAIQVVYNALESCPFTGVGLVMHHGLQDLLVTARNQTQGTKDLQHRHLGLDVLRGQTLGDGVDPGDVCEDVSPANGVVHDGLDAGQGHGVDVGLRRVPVHPRQQVEQTVQAIGLQEAGHETVRLSPQRNLKTIETPTALWKL